MVLTLWAPPASPQGMGAPPAGQTGAGRVKIIGKLEKPKVLLELIGIYWKILGKPKVLLEYVAKY